jgi:hypothetical protein
VSSRIIQHTKTKSQTNLYLQKLPKHKIINHNTTDYTFEQSMSKKLGNRNIHDSHGAAGGVVFHKQLQEMGGMQSVLSVDNDCFIPDWVSCLRHGLRPVGTRKGY